SATYLQVNGDESGSPTDDHIVVQIDPRDARKLEVIVNDKIEYDDLYYYFNSVQINGGSGHDTIDIRSLPRMLQVSITEGDFGSLNLGSNHSLQNVKGKIIISDPLGQFTILSADDSANTTDHSDGSAPGPVTISAIGIDGLTLGGIVYANSLDFLSVAGGT